MQSDIEQASADLRAELLQFNKDTERGLTKILARADALIAAAGTASPPDDPPADDDTPDLPPATDDDGWTEFEPSADSRVILVGFRDGDSPWAPADTYTPVDTVAEGIALLRDGYPDQLLLRRGDTFHETLGDNWMLSGRSESEKLVIGSYGDPSLPRPVLNTGTDRGFSIYKDDPRKHIAIVGIEFRPGERHKAEGIRIVSNGAHDIHLEDLKISGYTSGIELMGYDDNRRGSKAVIHRCTIIDNAGRTHSQGIYSTQWDGLKITECVFDRNGWDWSRGRNATATIFAHNIYLQPSVTGVYVGDNFIARAASHGLQARGGGYIWENVFWQNPIAILFGNEGDPKKNEPTVGGGIRHNVITEAIDLNDQHRRRWGIQIQNGNGAGAEANILTSFKDGEGIPWDLSDHRNGHGINRNVSIFNNITHDAGDRFHLFDRTDRDSERHIRFTNNVYSGTSVGGYFLPVEGMNAEGSRSAKPGEFGDWTLADYAADVMQLDIDEFIDRLRDQRRGNWDARLHAPAIRAWFSGKFGGEG